MVFSIVFLAITLVPSLAFAYIGPGAGISAFGSLLALLAAVGLAIVGFVWYPVKRMRNKRRKAAAQTLENAKETSH